MGDALEAIKEENREDLEQIAIGLYHLLKGENPAEDVQGMLKAGVNAMILIKKLDEKTFYGLVAASIAEIADQYRVDGRVAPILRGFIEYFSSKSYPVEPKS